MRHLSTLLFAAVACLTLAAAATATAGDGAAAPAAATPTPSPELLAVARAFKGSRTCKGAMFRPDGTSYPTRGTMKAKLELDRMWLRVDFTEARSKASPAPIKFTSYRSYDVATKTWTTVMLDSWGGLTTGRSAGPDASGRTTFETEASMLGEVIKGRDHEEAGAKKGSLRVWGEYAVDGQTYVKAYDLRCTR